jgi:hypothetical protein
MNSLNIVLQAAVLVVVVAVVAAAVVCEVRYTREYTAADII